VPAGRRLHLDHGGQALGPFVRGYCAGLTGRTGFAGLFGILVAPLGQLAAPVSAGLALALLLALASRSREALGEAARTSA
jgi:hypothetical protein